MGGTAIRGPRPSNAATAMGLVSQVYLGGNPSTLAVFGGRYTVFSLDDLPDEPKKPAAWVNSGQQF